MHRSFASGGNTQPQHRYNATLLRQCLTQRRTKPTCDHTILHRYKERCGICLTTCQIAIQRFDKAGIDHTCVDATICKEFSRTFRKSQKKVERNQFRMRKTMMYFEKQRKKMQKEMGQDPYLDTPN